MMNRLLSHEPVSRTYYSQRLALHYVEWVNDDAPPLLMVHGGSDHCRSWDWAARQLNQRFNILAPDLRGHGDSSWVNGTYRKLDYVYDLYRLIKSKNYQKVTIIAHSLGGWISLLLAGLKPDMVDKLVIIEGLQPMSPISKDKLKNSRQRRVNDWMDVVAGVSSFTQKRYSTFDAALQRMQSQNSHLTPEQAHHLTEHAIKQNEDGTYSWKYDGYIRSLDDSPELDEHEVIEIRSHITCPILLLQGRDSPFFIENDSEYIQSLHNCRVHNIPNAGHWLHHDQFDHFIEEVNAFLSL